MHLQYNTGAFRKHYKGLVARYDAADKEAVCEPRIRMLCQLIRESGLGVSIYSCEGHDHDEWSPNEGYVMLTGRNREAASLLIDLFQRCSAKLTERFGIDHMGEIEAQLATWDGEALYPCVVIRSPSFGSDAMADDWWSDYTKVAYATLKHYMAVNPEFNKELN